MSAKPEINSPPINDLRDRLLSRLPGHIERIVIYGSYARNEARDDSDVDVLVVVNESSPKLIETARATRYEVMEQYQYHPLLSLLLLTAKDWQGLAKYSAGLKHNIQNEGVTIWSRS